MRNKIRRAISFFLVAMMVSACTTKSEKTVKKQNLPEATEEVVTDSIKVKKQTQGVSFPAIEFYKPYVKQDIRLPYSDSDIKETYRDIGLMYLKGWSVYKASSYSAVRRNYKEAIRWFEKAANYGDVASNFYLGFMLQSGLGTKVDYKKSLSYYLVAANSSHGGAQNQLGILYQKGLGVSVDFTTALMWYERSAAQKTKAARANISTMYERGEGVEKNIIIAYRMLKWAAYNYSFAEKELYKLAKRMAPEQVELAKKQVVAGVLTDTEKNGAVSLIGKFRKIISSKDTGYNVNNFYTAVEIRKLSSGGNILSASDYILKTAEDNFLRGDFASSIKIWKPYATIGFSNMQFAVGLSYLRMAGNRSSTSETSKAFYWFSKAASQGHIEAAYKLAGLYFNGVGTEKDLSKALELYRFSAKQGHTGAKLNIATFYALGIGGNVDVESAVLLFTELANGGDSVAQVNLAVMHKFGYGVRQSDVLALKWLGLTRGRIAGGFWLSRDFYEGISDRQKIEARSLIDQWYKGRSKTKQKDMDLNDFITWDSKSAFEGAKELAENGNIKSQIQLASMYYYGDGISQSNILAYKWFKIASEQSEKGKKYYKLLTEQMTSFQKSKGELMSKEWLVHS